MTWTIRDILAAGFALEVAVDGAEAAVAESAHFWALVALLKGLWELDFGDTHSLDLLGRQNAELDRLDPSQRRTRVRESMQRHLVPIRSLLRARFPADLVLLP